MLLTYLPEALRQTNFFGDKLRLAPDKSNLDEMYDWGIRHYWYFWMCICLILCSTARIGQWISWYWDNGKDGNKKDYEKEHKIKSLVGN